MTTYDGADAPYWQALTEGRLLLPRCGGCGRWVWPAGHRCGHCGHIGLDWQERPMRAMVFAWTRTWHRFGMTESLDLPFTSIVATVDDCGVRLLGCLDDPDRIDPHIGQAVTGRAAETVVGNRSIPAIIWSRPS